MGYLSCKLRSAVVESHRRQRKLPSVQIFSFEDLENATQGFAVEMLLGKGSHGCVYKAVLRNGLQVAVKRPSYGRRMLEDEAAFDNEIRILSKLNNPRLVRLLGFCHDSNKEKLLVVELMHNGNLYDILHDPQEAREPLIWSKRVHVALQIARALCDIHSTSPPLIHRDIKSSNILIDSHGNAKLGDFGLALWGHAASSSTPPAGTLGYLDPEYTTPDMLSTKNDVFSFGILLLEIMSGRNAIDVNHNPPSIVDWAVPLIKAGKVMAVCDPRVQPPKSISSLKQMAILAARCVRDKSSRRPDMVDVVRQLQEISRRISSSMFNGIACKMKRRATRSKQKEGLVEECKAPPSLQHTKPCKKGCQRSLKVYDENRSLFHVHGRRDESDTIQASTNSRFISIVNDQSQPSVRNRTPKVVETYVVDLQSHGKRRLFDLFKEAAQGAVLTPARSEQGLQVNVSLTASDCPKAVQPRASGSGSKELKESVSCWSN